MDCAFFMLHVLYEFQSRENRSPEIATKEADLSLLESLVDSVAKKVGHKCTEHLQGGLMVVDKVLLT